MKKVSDLQVRIFADGADKEGMLEMYRKPFIKGFTTNPTLMRKAGISNYTEFAKDIPTADKITPLAVAEAIIQGVTDDVYEMHVGQTQQLHQHFFSQSHQAFLVLNKIA